MTTTQQVQQVLADLLDQDAIHHVQYWHPDDQRIYRETPASLEERVALVRQARIDRACEALRAAGVDLH